LSVELAVGFGHCGLRSVCFVCMNHRALTFPVVDLKCNHGNPRICLSSISCCFHRKLTESQRASKRLSLGLALINRALYSDREKGEAVCLCARVSLKTSKWRV